MVGYPYNGSAQRSVLHGGNDDPAKDFLIARTLQHCRHPSERRHLILCNVTLQLEAAASCLTEAEVPIKRLLLLLDLARQGVPEGSHIPLDRWMQVLQDLSLQ